MTPSELVFRRGSERVDFEATCESFDAFDAHQCTCFLPQDRERILGVIASAFGDMNNFNRSVRLEKSLTARHGKQLLLASEAGMTPRSQWIASHKRSAGSRHCQGHAPRRVRTAACVSAARVPARTRATRTSRARHRTATMALPTPSHESLVSARWRPAVIARARVVPIGFHERRAPNRGRSSPGMLRASRAWAALVLSWSAVVRAALDMPEPHCAEKQKNMRSQKPLRHGLSERGFG